MTKIVENAYFDQRYSIWKLRGDTIANVAMDHVQCPICWAQVITNPIITFESLFPRIQRRNSNPPTLWTFARFKPALLSELKCLGNWLLINNSKIIQFWCFFRTEPGLLVLPGLSGLAGAMILYCRVMDLLVVRTPISLLATFSLWMSTVWEMWFTWTKWLSNLNLEEEHP